MHTALETGHSDVINLLVSGQMSNRDVGHALARMPRHEAVAVMASLPAASQVALVSASIGGADTAPHLLLLPVQDAARVVLCDAALFHVPNFRQVAWRLRFTSDDAAAEAAQNRADRVIAVTLPSGKEAVVPIMMDAQRAFVYLMTILQAQGQAWRVELLEDELDSVFVGFILAAHAEEVLEVDDDLWDDFLGFIDRDVLLAARRESHKGMAALEDDLVTRHADALRAMFTLPTAVADVADAMDRSQDDLLGDLLRI